MLERRQLLRGHPEDVFGFFAEAGNLERITPPWLRFRVLTPGPIEMRAGMTIEYRLRLHAFPLRWLTRIESWEPPRRFIDVQLRGPYRIWHHTHSFEPRAGGVLMRDVVRYALPFGPLGRLAHAALVRRDLERIFDFRALAVGRALSRRAAHDDAGPRSTDFPECPGSPSSGSRETSKNV